MGKQSAPTNFAAPGMLGASQGATTLNPAMASAPVTASKDRPAPFGPVTIADLLGSMPTLSPGGGDNPDLEGRRPRYPGDSWTNFAADKGNMLASFSTNRY